MATTIGLPYATHAAVSEKFGSLVIPFDPQTVAIVVLALVAGVCIVDIARFAYYVHVGLDTGNFNFYSVTVLKKIAQAWRARETYLRRSLDGMHGVDGEAILDIIADAAVKYE